MPGILLRDGEPIERALKRFKKVCEKAGVISDLRKKKYFEKPSELRKRKNAEAKRKQAKNQKQNEL
jgi:small subunit ribosomal protein S21